VGLLDQLVLNWKLFLAGVIALTFVLSGFIVTTFSHEVSVVSTIVLLAILGVLLKIPDRYSSIGGTDIGMAATVIIASTQGALMGVMFAAFVTIVGGRTIEEGPQFTAASTIIHMLVAVLAALLVVLTPESYLFPVLAFVIAGHLVGAPTYVALGNPPETQLVFSLVNIIWNYALLGAFGVYLLQLLL
jgi:hypothetical protein